MDPISFVGCIYLITNLVNGKMYVGATSVGITRRWVQHRSASKKGSRFALHAAIRKYGERFFKIENLEEIQGTHADLMAAEVRQILVHDCLAPKGYNLTAGGDGVDYAVPGVREKHLEAVREVSQDPAWQEAVRAWVLRRETDPEFCARRVEGIRRSASARRSKNCTLCGVLLTEHNSSVKRNGTVHSWCAQCQNEYQREYQAQRRATPAYKKYQREYQAARYRSKKGESPCDNTSR